MSQHPSLRSSKGRKRHRSILKRFERLKHMKEKGDWEEDKTSIYGLPKIKIVKFKVKKEKAEEEAVAAEGVAAEATEATAKATPEAKDAKDKAAPKKEEKGKGAGKKEAK